MNPFQSAVEQGYDEERILDFLFKSYPQVRPKLKKARDAGYTAKEIIDFFSKQNEQRQDYGNSSQQAIHRQKSLEDIEKNKALVKGGINLASQIALPAGIAKGASKIGQGIAKGLTGIAGKVLPEAAVNQTVKAITPSVSALLSKHNILNKIESLASRNAPEAIGAMLQKHITPDAMKEIEQLGGKPFTEVVKDYAQTFLDKAEKSPLSRESLRHQIQNKGSIDEKATSEATPVAQEDISVPQEGYGTGINPAQVESTTIMPEKRALLPDGNFGKIKNEKQGIAEIETSDGKVRTKKLDELVLEPEDAAVQALELVKSFTPEQQRSSHHAISAYDPEEKTAFFLFHNGTAYNVYDIQPEEYEKISNEVQMAKTTGKSQYGVWSTGEGSRGAAYHQIVKGMNKPYKKLQVGYNMLNEWQRLIHEREKKERRKKPK